MSKNIIRLPAVTAKTGLSPSTIWRYEKAGEFPRRVQLGPNSVGWVVDEVDAWVERRDRAGAPKSDAERLIQLVEQIVVLP